jgi:hypothetical protein
LPGHERDSPSEEDLRLSALLLLQSLLDIQGIFCEACDRLEVAWRQDGPWNISVARRDAVAILDRHIGPKR